MGYVMPSTRTVFCRMELREKVEARIGLFLGLKSAHTDRLFVVISSEKISERFKSELKSAHTNRFSICGNVYDRLDYETHATDTLKLCVIYKYGNITYKAR